MGEYQNVRYQQWPTTAMFGQQCPPLTVRVARSNNGRRHRHEGTRHQPHWVRRKQYVSAVVMEYQTANNNCRSPSFTRYIGPPLRIIATGYCILVGINVISIRRISENVKCKWYVKVIRMKYTISLFRLSSTISVSLPFLLTSSSVTTTSYKNNNHIPSA